MSENRFWFVIDKGKLEYVQDNVTNEKITVSELEDLLNEQQELIEELQVSDEIGWKRAEMFEKKCPKELHNQKMYIKRLEYKVQKFKEENEQLKKELKGLNRKYIAFSEATDKRLKEMMTIPYSKKVGELEKEIHRWKNLYELKDAEVTARVDTLNRVCNYYLTETRFKGDTDPNEAVKEVINEILNAPIYEE